MNRFWRSRSTALVVTLTAVALVAAACSFGGAEAEETTTTTAAPETTTTTAAETTTTTEPAFQNPYGGEAIIGDSQEPRTLNPFLPGGDTLIGSAVGMGYRTGVSQVDGYSLELVPEVVTELPTTSNGGVTVNEDGTMTVRYQIKDEAQWDDGTPISGDDFQFTLNTILDPELPIDKRTYENIISSSAGPKTFEYTLSAPTALYELLFSRGVDNGLIPKHAVEGSDFLTDWNDKMWASAGPFKFSEWAKGEYITLERNENYWKTDPETNQQLPYLDSVTFRFIPETESLLNAFKAREVDVINPDLNIETIQALQALEPDGAVVEVIDGPVWEHLNFQFGPGRLDRNPTSCTDNYNMRLAVARAIDRELIVEDILSGEVEPMGSYVSAFSPTLSQEAWDQYTYDPASANEAYLTAVEETGVECSVAFTTTSNNSARLQLSELLVGMMEAAGIPYENQLEDSQLFFGQTLDNGNWDLGQWAWVGSPGLASLIAIHDVFDPEAPPPDGSNYYHWGTESSSVVDDDTVRFAEVRDAMNATVDDQALIALLEEAENLLADNLVIFPLYSRPETAAVWGDEVAGFKLNPTKATHTWNIEDWHRVDI